MKKIVFLASLILISIIKSIEYKQNNPNTLLPNIFGENSFDAELNAFDLNKIGIDAELLDLANITDSSSEERSQSSGLRISRAQSRASISNTPSGRRSTPNIALALASSSPGLAKMIGTFNAFKDFKASSSPSRRSLSQASTPEMKLSGMVSSFSDFNSKFEPIKLMLQDGSNLSSQHTNLQKLMSENTPTIIYSPRHVFSGSKGGGKHHFQDFKELLEIADLKDKNLPFVLNNESNQLMGIIATGQVKDSAGEFKTKFSSIFPLGLSPDDINEKLIALNFLEPHAKGKIYGKSFQNNSLIMKFDDYFIVIDLDRTKPEGLQDLFVANSIYPLFNLTKITQDDLSKSDQLISLVNYSILQQDGKWSDNITAQISSEDLNMFLQRALSGMEEFKTYVLACSSENILINMPYDFAVNRVNLDFETHAQKITKNMYKITLEIPKSIADMFNPGSYNYCDIITSD
jgi:hypothetical protein